jgi:uncharacterized protein
VSDEAIPSLAVSLRAAALVPWRRSSLLIVGDCFVGNSTLLAMTLEMKGLYNLSMSMTALDLSPEALKKYRPLDAIRKRRAKMSAEISRRRRRAMLAARKAAKLLKSEFGAAEVILFGSLARPGSFMLYSDIDLAVRGIDPERFFAASAAIERIDMNFQIDVVELETSSPALRGKIEQDGKPL